MHDFKTSDPFFVKLAMALSPNKELVLNGIYRYKKNQPIVWFNHQKSKSNQHCLYCGRFVGEGSVLTSNKEHLIGKKFIPTGELGNGNLFNLIFRACEECNKEKSDIERHISSVTLYNSPARADSQIHNDIAQRKAEKDYHPRKQGTLIKDSGDNLTVSTNFGLADISFSISGPPQADPIHIELLAFWHVQGIFSLITSCNPLTVDGTTLLDNKFFHFHGSYPHSDWGNPNVLEIMERTREVPCYANIETANGFFKAIMCREKGEDGQWFWALEWNKSLRVFGAISLPDSTPTIFDNLPNTGWRELGAQEGARTRIRGESPLDSKLDILFSAEIENAG